MKTSQWLQVTVLATASFFTVATLSPSNAATFDSVEINPNNFIAVSAPFGNNQHQLLILEQISNQQRCWNESGSNPVSVEPLLLNFDFTGICSRSTDSNGYSIRMNGQDLGLDYLLRIVERDGELVLVGTPRVNPNAPEIEIGRTQGLSNGFEKIFLNPGWRFTRRIYQGRALGHIYLTNDGAAPYPQESNTTAQPLPLRRQPLPPRAQPLPPKPERELIFTKPQAAPMVPEREIPSLGPQPLPSLPTPKSKAPVFVVPTVP